MNHEKITDITVHLKQNAKVKPSFQVMSKAQYLLMCLKYCKICVDPDIRLTNFKSQIMLSKTSQTHNTAFSLNIATS